MKIEGVVKLLKAKDDMKSNVTLLMISLCGLMLGVSIFMNILPSNPLLRPNILSQFAPQGFAFYSKNPTDDIIFLHASSPKVNIPNSSPSNLFGFSRKGRAQMVELGSIEVDYPNSDWESCNSEKDCVDKANTQGSTVITNEFKNLDAGEYIVYYKEPLNWHWTKYEETSSFNGRVLRVEIK